MLAVLFLNHMSMKKRATRRQQHSKMVKTDVPSEVESRIEYCRTCLNPEGLVALFYGKETEEKRSHDLKLVTGLEIKMNDGLSQKICTQCIDTMNTALQFRRTSKKADKTLRNFVNGSKVKKKDAKERIGLKELNCSVQPKSEVEKLEFDVDCSYNYDDTICEVEFQHDYLDYGLQEVEARPKVKQRAAAVKRKRTMLPNSSSYKCNTCNKEFRMKATFKAHMRFHTNYCVCETCGKRCRNNHQLQEHKRARHGLGRIHKCTFCEYSSATKEALTIHERRHTGERPYICDHCGATFHRRSNLVQHMPIHLPEKNFQCPICPIRAQSRKLLAIHQYKYHRENKYRYVCPAPACGNTYSRPGNVRVHLARAHGLPRHHQQPRISRLQINYPAERKSELDVSQGTCITYENFKGSQDKII